VAERDDRTKEPSNPRRDFLTRGTLGAAALVVAPHAAAQATAADKLEKPTPAPASGRAALPTEAEARADMDPPAPIPPGAPIEVNPVSDYMVDVLKSLQIDYIATNPGSSFDSLHESIVNHGGNLQPELLTVLHEDAGAAMAHAYAKAAGKPMGLLVHGTVGLLHASMGIFQAFADRVPLFAMVAHQRNAVTLLNRPHSAQDMGVLTRDFTKWDDEPTTAARFGESALRAYEISMTPPRGPTLLVLDSALQAQSLKQGPGLRVPTLRKVAFPQGDVAAVREAAQMLVAAERPMLRPQKLAHTPRGWDLMIELAEVLQAPVTVGTYGSWQNFPSWHPLYGSGGQGYTPDVTLGLEVKDMTGVVAEARAKGGKTINICADALWQGKNIQEFGPWAEVDLLIAADGETTLPLLIEEIRRAITPARRRALDARGTKIAAAHAAVRKQNIEDARYGWNSRPISVARMIAELAGQIRNDDWAIVSGHQFTGDWQRKLMNFDRHYRYIGDCGGFGIGYDAPASVGGALGHRKEGRLCIGIVGDGDFNFVGAGALWSAAHHKIPLLLVIHNNRAYHAEVMILQRACARRGRGALNAHVGTTITNPNVDYARIAQGYGVYAEGPVEDPDALGAAFGRALARVRAGEPALVDVVSQPR
jgi:acetolactate synthase I/II/III large subunit